MKKNKRNKRIFRKEKINKMTNYLAMLHNMEDMVMTPTVFRKCLFSLFLLMRKTSPKIKFSQSKITGDRWNGSVGEFSPCREVRCCGFLIDCAGKENFWKKSLSPVLVINVVESVIFRSTPAHFIMTATNSETPLPAIFFKDFGNKFCRLLKNSVLRHQ